MRRAEDILVRAPPRAQVDEARFPLRLVDVLITSMATLAAVYLLVAGTWAPGAWRSIGVFSVIAAGPPVFRALAQRYPRRRIFETIASTWLMPGIVAAHFHMSPILDTAHPVLLDRYLALADLRLFGLHPSVVLGQLAPPWLTEYLMVSYYSYFVGPLSLGLLLFFRGRRAHYDEFNLALGIFFAINFTCYVLVPAIGPRYYLEGLFDGPVQGIWLTPYLDSMMRSTAFDRDCFPSGHTGVTLIMLTYAYRFRRRFFWLVLPLGTGLVFGTLVGRFHYGIDLLLAVPVVAVAVLAAGALSRAYAGEALSRVRSAPRVRGTANV